MGSNAVHVLHNLSVPQSRYVVPHESKTLMLGFHSKSMSKTFMKLVLRDYRLTESSTYLDRTNSCVKATLTFPLEENELGLSNDRIVSVPMEYYANETMFRGMTRHAIDFLFVHKFAVDCASTTTPQLRVQGVWVEFNGESNRVDPVDLFEHNKLALDRLYLT